MFVIYFNGRAQETFDISERSAAGRRTIALKLQYPNDVVYMAYVIEP